MFFAKQIAKYIEKKEEKRSETKKQKRKIQPLPEIEDDTGEGDDVMKTAKV